MDENKNFLLAMALSIGVLVLWQVFIAGPEAELLRQQQLARQAEQQRTEQMQQTPQPGAPGVAPPPGVTPPQVVAPNGIPLPAGIPAQPTATRDAAVKNAPRIAIDTPSIKGSISLKGARIDDVLLKEFRITVKPESDNVVLFSPAGAPDPYYTEYGWAQSAGDPIKLPDSNTIWTVEGPNVLTPDRPVTLVHDNGQGFVFRNRIAVDKHYMFTVTQEVQNNSGKIVTLNPYSIVSRHKKPKLEAFYIQHEGPLGVFGDESKTEVTYDDAAKKASTFAKTGGWLGFTDKYWAAVVVPDQKLGYNAQFSGPGVNGQPGYTALYVLNGMQVNAGAKTEVTGRLFAGAKQVTLIDAYEADLGIPKFELLIDWGWFYFITKPLFYVLDFFFKLFGNFGVSILIVTVLIKLAFFPLANKSYESMSKLKKLQPDMMKIRDRYKDDKMRQQQEMMTLYKKEKVNPMSGCLPILVQIPVFFALYKVLFITIEMRHAPFFGWVQDLSAADPTSIFNLFGLLPFTVPSDLILGIFSLQIGVWPLLMGITMWVQMKLNPAPTDPVQAQVFNWMPVLFTFMLGTFPAGLVIYWTWNNLLSILQQWFIMKKQGVEVDLLGNMGLSRFIGGNGKETAPAKPANDSSAQRNKSTYRGKNV